MKLKLVSEDNAFVHVSGHPNREDLRDMYGWVKPRSIIPVHGEHRHMTEHINFAKEMQVPYPLQIENGDISSIISWRMIPKIIDKAPVPAECIVDGKY